MEIETINDIPVTHDTPPGGISYCTCPFCDKKFVRDSPGGCLQALGGHIAQRHEIWDVKQNKVHPDQDKEITVKVCKVQ